MQEIEQKKPPSNTEIGCSMAFLFACEYAGLWFLGAFFYTLVEFMYFFMNINSPLDDAANALIVAQYGFILLFVSFIPLFIAWIVNALIAICVGLLIGFDDDSKWPVGISVGVFTGFIVWIAMDIIMNWFNANLHLSTFRDLSFLAIPAWLVYVYAFIMGIIAIGVAGLMD